MGTESGQSEIGILIVFFKILDGECGNMFLTFEDDAKLNLYNKTFLYWLKENSANSLYFKNVGPGSWLPATIHEFIHKFIIFIDEIHSWNE